MIVLSFTIVSLPSIFIFLTLLSNILSSAGGPATTGIIRNTVHEKKEVEEALSIFYLLGDVMTVVGPMAAAAIMSFSQGRIIFVIAAVFFALSAILLLDQYKHQRVNQTQTEQSESNQEKKLDRLSIKDIITNQPLFLVFLTIFIFLFSINMIDVSVGILLRSISINPVFQSFFIASMGLGGITGALFIMRLMKKLELSRIMIFCLFMFCLVIWSISFVNQIWLVILFAFLAGSFTPGVFMVAEVKRQSLVKEEQASQLSGMSMSFNALGQALGILSSTLVVGQFGAKGTFILSGFLIFIIAILGLRILPKNSETFSEQNENL